MIFAQSIGPLDFWGRLIVRQFCRGLDRATVRDERSRGCWQSSCRKRRSNARADPVFLYDRPGAASISSSEGLGPESGAVRGRERAQESPAFAMPHRSCARAVDRLAQRHGIRAAFLPLGGAGDAEVSTDVIRACASKPVLLTGVHARKGGRDPARRAGRRRDAAARADPCGALRRAVSRDRLRSESLGALRRFAVSAASRSGVPALRAPGRRRRSTRSSIGWSRERDAISRHLRERSSTPSAPQPSATSTCSANCYEAASDGLSRRP